MKQNWKAGNMLYPVPAVMVTTKSKDLKDNILTVAWVGTVCTNPAMVYISVRKERYSYTNLVDSLEFVINLVPESLSYACDFCGVKSGRDIDKFKELNLGKEEMKHVKCVGIKESPVNIECKVEKILPLGSHDMFIAKVLGVNIDEALLDESGKLNLDKANLIMYSHGEYFSLGKSLGHFGYSVRKKK